MGDLTIPNSIYSNIADYIVEHIHHIYHRDEIWGLLDTNKMAIYSIIVDRRVFKWIVEGDDHSRENVDALEFAERWKKRLQTIDSNRQTSKILKENSLDEFISRYGVSPSDKSLDVRRESFRSGNSKANPSATSSLIMNVKDMEFFNINNQYNVYINEECVAFLIHFEQFELPYSKNIFAW